MRRLIPLALAAAVLAVPSTAPADTTTACQEGETITECAERTYRDAGDLIVDELFCLGSCLPDVGHHVGDAVTLLESTLRQVRCAVEGC